LWEGGTGHKLTKERNKNKDDQHQNTNIPFKRGINTRGGKKDDFSSPPKPVAALAAETLPLQRKKPNQTNLHAISLKCLSEWRVRERSDN
jgi:hypothetical protein